MLRRNLLWFAMAMSAGCGDWWKFDRPAAIVDADLGAPDADPVDSAPPDAPTACVPDSITCDDDADRYVECSSEGTAVVDVACAFGCASAEARCLDLEPSNSLAGYLDMAATMGTDQVVANGTTWNVNTTTGVVMNGGVEVDLPDAEFMGMRVYVFNSLEVEGTIKATGNLPIALVAAGDVTITGLVDVSADASASGAGFAPQGMCGGGESPSGGCGAGGAGRYDVGGAGGSCTSGSGLNGGLMLRDPDLIPLNGGCRGGCRGCISQPLCSTCGVGGAGGGSVHIVTRATIALRAAGTIDASGGGGRSGSNTVGSLVPGGGGGSGGGVLLEARAIVLDGANVVLSTKGGGGASAGDGSAGHHGADGGTGPGAASGGFNLSGGAGGAGGTDAALPGAGNSGGGGGGGSAGEARFNVASGTVTPVNGAAVRSRFVVGAVGTR